MSRQSGVRISAGPTSQDRARDLAAETTKIVGECIRGMTDSEILESGATTIGIVVALSSHFNLVAKSYLRPQHLKCHHPWTTLSNRSAPRGAYLFDHLALLVSGELRQLSSRNEDRTDGTPDPNTVAALQQVLRSAGTMLGHSYALPSCHVLHRLLPALI